MPAQILKNNAHADNDTTFSQDSIWNAIDNFYDEQEEELVWSEEDTPTIKQARDTWDNKFVDFILPRKTSEISFDETVKLLTELFSPKTSLFHKSWKCLNLTKNDEEDFATYAAVVNKHCDEFKLSELTANNFKCLVFAQGLEVGKWTKSNSPKTNRRLSKIEMI